jgi:hypothetical protein
MDLIIGNAQQYHCSEKASAKTLDMAAINVYERL